MRRHAGRLLRRYHRRNHRDHSGPGPRRPGPLRMDGHGVHAVRDHHDPHRREALRPVREEAPVPHRPGAFRRRIRPRRNVHQHGVLHRMPCDPGTRRRYPHPRRHGGGRRPVLPQRQGQDAGDARSDLRSRKRYRAPPRRIHRGSGELALVLLHQRPAGHHRVRPHHQEVPDARGRRAEAHRRQGHRPPDAVPRRHPAVHRVRRIQVRVGQRTGSSSSADPSSRGSAHSPRQ